MRIRTSGRLPSLVRVGSLALPLLLAGCLSPLALHRAVLAYDETVLQTMTEQLLLNILRARFDRPIHFTRVPSVAATFDFRVSAGITPPEGEARGLVGPVINTTVAENPTITIVPMEGEEFSQRLLTPMDESRITSLVALGTQLNMLLRLVASDIRIKGDSGYTIVENDPRQRASYEEFRRRVLHLTSLYEAHHLRVEKVISQILWTGDLPAPPGPADVLEALSKDYYWTRSPHGGDEFMLSRKRLLITNYHPATLSLEEQQRLGAMLETWPPNEILLDIRPGHPGGDYPLSGTIRLRSFEAVLEFLADSTLHKEYAVEKDRRTGPTPDDPAELLQIAESARRPPDAVVAVGFEGRTYAIRQGGAQADWNLRVFQLLYELFQMTVRPVQAPVPGITIAK